MVESAIRYQWYCTCPNQYGASNKTKLKHLKNKHEWINELKGRQEETFWWKEIENKSKNKEKNERKEIRKTRRKERRKETTQATRNENWKYKEKEDIKEEKEELKDRKEEENWVNE